MGRRKQKEQNGDAVSDFGRVTRNIDQKVSLELWAKSAGRCEFSGCNKVLFESPITGESENLGQRAHVYSFSEDGPRGRGPFNENTANINSADNLMLMCHGCHKLIDDDNSGLRYSADLLLVWKRDHEDRIHIVTEITPEKKSNVVFYSSNIGEHKALFGKTLALSAMFPHRYPASGRPIELSMKWSGEDRNDSFWQTESRNLKLEFDRKISPIIAEGGDNHFSVFAIAPMPLLIRLGCLLGDISSVDVYQFIRNPKGWNWQDQPENFYFSIVPPKITGRPPVLIISISASISHSRVTEVIGKDVSIWEIKVPPEHTHNDCIRHPDQLAQFARTTRQLLDSINSQYGTMVPLQIFPAMSVSCSVEFGRLRMPKADPGWVIFDQNHHAGGFTKAITIQGENDAAQ